MKVLLILISAIAIFTADSRVFPDTSDRGPNFIGNVTHPPDGQGSQDLDERFPEEHTESNTADESKYIYEKSDTDTINFADEVQTIIIDSSNVDQQHMKERKGLNAPELRGKQQNKILKQIVKDLEYIKYNLTHSDSILKEALKSIKDNRNNVTGTGKEVKKELQSIRDHQHNLTDVGEEIRVELKSIEDQQNNFTAIGEELKGDIEYFRDHQYNLTDIGKHIEEELQSIRDYRHNLTYVGKEIKVELKSIKDQQNNFTAIGEELKGDIEYVRDHQYNLTDIGKHIEEELQSIRDHQNNFTDSSSELKNEISSLKQNIDYKNSVIISILCSIITGKGCPGGYILFSCQCFKYLNDQRRKWSDADAKCRSLGLILAEPRDPVGLRNHLMAKYTTDNSWLGGRGTGSAMVWQHGGQVVSKSSSLWHPGQPGSLSSSHCLDILLHTNVKWHPNSPYWSWGCTNTAYTICEMV